MKTSYDRVKAVVEAYYWDDMLISRTDNHLLVISDLREDRTSHVLTEVCANHVTKIAEDFGYTLVGKGNSSQIFQH